MVKAVFDTNIIIDYLNGVEKAKETLSRFEVKSISIITWMEVMIGSNDENKLQTENFLNSFETVEINSKIATKSVEIRKNYKIKLPDAIIWASAIVTDAVLVTRNTKDFSDSEIGIFIPYQL